MNEYTHFIYKITKDFPKSELFGTISQFRRAGISIILNYIEGYARRKPLVRLNFLEISYGSLKESTYLFAFSLEEKFIDKDQHDYGVKLSDEIGAMLWRELEYLEKYKK